MHARHREVQTTARYALITGHSVKTPAGRIADSLAADMATPLGASSTM